MALGTVAGPVAVLRSVLFAFLASASAYAVFLALLTVPSLQRQVIYLQSLTQTWGQDLNIPEQWGFLHNQVTPFALNTPDGETLHAWHILPLGLYRRNEQKILEEPSGLAPDFNQRLASELLRGDPESLLVLYLHGAGGTLGSGHRPASYRAASAGAPDRIHIVAIDYRGFGLSTGAPSEDGLLTDATTLVNWAMSQGIPPHRIIIWGQSLGTAVATSLVHHMALRHEPVLFSGLVLVAPFADVPSLTATYRVAGRIPLLGPVARFPLVFDFLNTFILDKWPTKERLAGFVRRCEALPVDSKTYHISMIHAEDDLAIPWHHSEQLFWHAVNASLPSRGISFQELGKHKEATRVHADAGGWSVTHESTKGIVTEHITQYGVHDKIMGYPVVSLAVLKAFGI